jgi:hypothetical protein
VRLASLHHRLPPVWLCCVDGDARLNGRQIEVPLPEQTTVRRQIRRFILAAAALGLMAGAEDQERVGQITTFDAEGTFQSEATLGGTLTIDTTIGDMLISNMVHAATNSQTLLNVIQTQGSYYTGSGTIYQIQLGVQTTVTPQLTLWLPPASLAGYAGAPMASIADFLEGNFISFYELARQQEIYWLKAASPPFPSPLP